MLSVSIIIPTLNSTRTLGLCLKSITSQNYPEELVEIIVADGGSTDQTKEISQAYFVKLVDNPLKTGEAGKAVAARLAKNDILAFIDSDNILPQPDWLTKMLQPFMDQSIIASEPLFYSYRSNDSYLSRYFALLGMSDPICLFLNNYDRYSYITNNWTGLRPKTIKHNNYLEVILDNKGNLPTIGANGFLIRRDVYQKAQKGDYFFDIDLLSKLISQSAIKVAKVKIGIVHLFSNNLSSFYRKQSRRIKDYLYFKKQDQRNYSWQKQSKKGLLKFILSCLLVFPLIFQAIKGYLRKADWVWLIHPLICEITFFTYALGYISSFKQLKPASRSNWRQ